MDLVGTDVATGSSQEDTFDPGWRYEDRIGMRIWRVEWMIGDGIDVPWDVTTNIRSAISLGTRNETAIPSPSADGVISYISLHHLGITTSGSPNFMVRAWGEQFYPKGLLVVADRLYVWFKNDTAETQQARIRVWYTTESLSDADYREFFEIWARA